MIIVGLTGAPLVGKTTIGHYLNERHGFMYYHLEANLLAGLCALYSLDPKRINEVEDQYLEAWGYRTPRELKDGLGAHVRHVIGDDAFVRVGEWILAEAQKTEEQALVIDGLNVDSEIRWIHSLGGQVWCMERRYAEGYPSMCNPVAGVRRVFGIPVVYVANHDDIATTKRRVDGLVGVLHREERDRNARESS